MSYCSDIKTDEVLNEFSKNKLETKLEQCENSCKRYFTCDTVTTMQDRLKEMDGDLLFCPNCGEFFEHSDCPDLFYEDEMADARMKQQYELLLELQQHGFNIVTCGECGHAFIHRI